MSTWRDNRSGWLVAATLVGAAVATGCGKETPDRAVYEVAHALEHEDFEDACVRLFSGAYLPAPIARALQAPAGSQRPPRDWERELRVCRRALGRAGPYRTVELDRPLVRSVRRLDVSAQDGITAAAFAQVTLNYGPAETLRLVEFRGLWRVVLVHGRLTDAGHR